MSKAIFTVRQESKIRKLVVRYRRRFQMGKHWRRRTADELWRKVLQQVVVAGGARAGALLDDSVEVKQQVSLKRLRALRTNAALRTHLHGVMRAMRTRWVGKYSRNKKIAAAVQNFRALEAAGGPWQFFAGVAKLRSEAERIKYLSSRDSGLAYYKAKGARDTLIDLKLAKNCMAIDTRIVGLLRELGVPGRDLEPDQYGRIEGELIERIAKSCHLTGAELDRILFQNYDAILVDLKLLPN